MVHQKIALYSHFLLLSEIIEKETKVIISITTLKRFFGKRTTDTDYVPQLATRNALAIYTGFEDWNELSKVSQAENINGRKTNTRNAHKKISPLVLIVIIMLLVTLGSFLLYFLGEKKHNIPKINLGVRNEVDTIPFTAIFDYTLPNNLKDTLYLMLPGLGYVPLSNENRIITHWFRYADFYRLPLMVEQYYY